MWCVAWRGLLLIFLLLLLLCGISFYLPNDWVLLWFLLMLISHFFRLINLKISSHKNFHIFFNVMRTWRENKWVKRWLWFMESVIYGHSSPYKVFIHLCCWLSIDFALICIQLIQNRHQLTNPAWSKKFVHTHIKFLLREGTSECSRCSKKSQSPTFTACGIRWRHLTGGGANNFIHSFPNGVNKLQKFQKKIYW